MQNFPSQGLTLHRCRDLRHSCDDTGSLSSEPPRPFLTPFRNQNYALYLLDSSIPHTTLCTCCSCANTFQITATLQREPFPLPFMSASSPIIPRAETVSSATSLSPPRPRAAATMSTDEVDRESLPHLRMVHLRSDDDSCRYNQTRIPRQPSSLTVSLFQLHRSHTPHCGAAATTKTMEKTEECSGSLLPSHPGGLSPEFPRDSVSSYCPLTIPVRSWQGMRSYKMPGSALDTGRPQLIQFL